MKDEAEKNIRETTDEFVCRNEEIANQIISDIVNVLVEQDVDARLAMVRPGGFFKALLN